MSSNKKNEIEPDELRRRAEEIEREGISQTAEFLDALSPEATRQLIRELRVHQIELELKNEELRQEQVQRKQVDKILRESEERFNQCAGQSRSVVWEVDAEGIYSSVSSVAEDVFGYHPAEIVGKKHFYDLHPESGREDFKTAALEVFRQHAVFNNYENRALTKAGQPIWLSTNGFPVLDDDGTLRVYRGSDLDITDRKRIEEELASREAQLRTLVETIPDLIWLKNSEGVYLSCNKMFEDFFGAKEADIVGKTDYDFVDKNLADFFREKDREAIAAGKPSVNEEWLTFANDGHQVLVETIKTPMVDARGKLIGVLGIARDITERKTAEKALQASQMRYKVLIEQSFDALALIDIQTLEVVEVNRRFTEMLGYSLPEDGPLYANEFSMDTKKILFKRYEKLNNQRILPVEARKYLHKNGGVVFAERAGALVEVGGRNYILATIRDLTEERRRQAELSVDVEFARRAQLELLPKISDSSVVTVRTIYHPSRIVSGDSYFLEWRNEGRLLRGFLIDITGHGLATALQTASINALLRETSTAKLTLLEQLRRIDSRAERYFSESSYASMIGFELDFAAMELRYVGDGITQFYFNGRKILAPGMFVGMIENPEFGTGVIPFAEGDCVHFLTDGFTDRIVQPKHEGFWSPDGKGFDADVAALEQLAGQGALRDDATALCFRIKGKPFA